MESSSALAIGGLSNREIILQGGGPTSAVDLCEEEGIVDERDDTMVALLRKLEREHPKLQDLGPRSHDIRRVLNSSAAILDALNPVRNTASVAHPNDELLGSNEAQLVINVGRSLLTYLDGKLAE